MPRIERAHLSVEAVADHPGQRLLRVRYSLAARPDDPLVGRRLDERVLVRAADLHDAPAPPTALSVEVADGEVTLAAGEESREHARAVRRVDLDVERDWWSADDAGAPVPIAELLDHLVARVELTHEGQVVASADSEVVTGSWGALGRD